MSNVKMQHLIFLKSKIFAVKTTFDKNNFCMFGKNRLYFPKPTFWFPTSIYQVKFHVENFEELTLIFAYMNNTYTYVVASCAKTCCSWKAFSTRFEHCIFTSCLGFHTAWKENMNTGCKKYNNLFCKYVYILLFNTLLQGEMDVSTLNEFSRIFLYANKNIKQE